MILDKLVLRSAPQVPSKSLQNNQKKCTRTALTILCTVISAHGVAAVNVLGFAVPGARSHQFAVLRGGQELAKRGHNLILLVSSEEALDKQRLGKRAFDGLHVATFQGPEGIGTQEWFVNQPRDVAEVCAPGVITRLATVLETSLVM